MFHFIKDSIIFYFSKYCIYGLKDEEMQLTDYKTKEYVKSVFEKFKYSIVHDGFLSVAISFDKEIVEEVFIEVSNIFVFTLQKKIKLIQF